MWCRVGNFGTGKRALFGNEVFPDPCLYIFYCFSMQNSPLQLCQTFTTEHQSTGIHIVTCTLYAWGVNRRKSPVSGRRSRRRVALATDTRATMGRAVFSAVCSEAAEDVPWQRLDTQSWRCFLRGQRELASSGTVSGPAGGPGPWRVKTQQRVELRAASQMQLRDSVLRISAEGRPPLQETRERTPVCVF
jgi:hypothetical protein